MLNKTCGLSFSARTKEAAAGSPYDLFSAPWSIAAAKVWSYGDVDDSGKQ